MFQPGRFLPLRAAACPQCGHSHVTGVDGAGERALSPALVADTVVGSVSCQVAECGAVWPAEHLHLLAAVLGVQTTTEVLAVGPFEE